jgi:hypothetical protein
MLVNSQFLMEILEETTFFNKCLTFKCLNFLSVTKVILFHRVVCG